MFDFISYISAYLMILAVAVIVWGYSAIKKNVNIVDSLWSLMFLLATVVYVLMSPPGNKSAVILALVMVWSLRLSFHLTLRNWGKDEDHRYQTIRRNNEPNFTYKSLYIIFGLQATLAWIISMPLHTAIAAGQPLSLLDFVAVAVVLSGLLFETIADKQLATFSANPENKNRTLDTGLWRYSRHPNYFGESVIAWGFYLFAFSAGAWWSIYAPILMTLLLLKVSGVSLMESTIKNRRPGYAEYVKNTSAFIPWFAKSTSHDSSHNTGKEISS